MMIYGEPECEAALWAAKRKAAHRVQIEEQDRLPELRLKS
jgi:hypothetical protein